MGRNGSAAFVPVKIARGAPGGGQKQDQPEIQRFEAGVKENVDQDRPGQGHDENWRGAKIPEQSK